MNNNVRSVNSVAVVLTALGAFGLSLAWYSPFVFGPIWLGLSHANPGAMPVWKVVIAPVRELVAAGALAQLIVRLDIDSVKRGLALGLGLWLSFHAVQMAGAAIWDNMPWPLAAVHGGDWLMKMAFMSVVLTWHAGTTRTYPGGGFHG
jgi:hypothetical protein